VAMAIRRAHFGVCPFWVVALSAGIILGACGAAGPAPVRIATGASPGTSLSDSPTPSAAVTVTTLTVLAKEMASGADDPDVTVGYAVLTTQQAAVTATSGALVNTNQPAYLVQLDGHFTALGASVPAGAKLPTGTYLIFVVDASSGFVIDWGVSRRKANLFALGSVIALSL
jgi:hypothetical protein